MADPLRNVWKDGSCVLYEICSDALILSPVYDKYLYDIMNLYDAILDSACDNWIKKQKIHMDGTHQEAFNQQSYTNPSFAFEDISL